MKIVMSEFLAFIAVTSFISGPVFLLLALVAPELSADSPENNGSGIMQLLLAIVGIGEMVAGSVLISWKIRSVKAVFEHGIEVKSRITSYTQDTATAVFEFTLQGQKHQVSKHVFGRRTFPDPKVGQEAVLIVHQDNPDKFVIKAQYL